MEVLRKWLTGIRSDKGLQYKNIQQWLLKFATFLLIRNSQILPEKEKTFNCQQYTGYPKIFPRLQNLFISPVYKIDI